MRALRATKIDDTKLDYWLPEIRSKFETFESGLRSSLANAIELGKRLIAAKERLPHGEFGRLFSDHKDPVQGALPFSRKWAYKLTVIAEHPTVVNDSHASHLPPDLETVYELSLMSAPALEAAIEAGEVRPDMKRAEAKQLVAEREPREDHGERKPKQKAIKTINEVVEDLGWMVGEAISEALRTYPNYSKLRPAILERLEAVLDRLRDHD